MRGIAALVVFASHLNLTRVTPGWMSWLTAGPLDGLVDGSAAVIFFFVLSGFVLTLGFVKARDLPRGWWRSFLVRRIFRIWPAFAVTILLAAGLRYGVGFGAVGAPSDTFLIDRYSRWWTTPFRLNDVLQTLWFNAPGERVELFDGPIWSLIVEIRVSMIFPLIILAVCRFRGLGWAAALMALAWAGGLAAGHLHVGTGTMVPSFLLGALLAAHVGGDAEQKASGSRVSTGLLLLGGISLYTVGALVMKTQQGPGKEPLSMNPFFLGLQLASVGSAVLILACLTSSRLKALLLSPVLQFLGLISYSFYLVHRVVIFAMMRAFMSRYQDGDPAALVIAAYATALPVSTLFAFGLQRFVEMPGNALGRRISARLG